MKDPYSNLRRNCRNLRNEKGKESRSLKTIRTLGFPLLVGLLPLLGSGCIALYGAGYAVPTLRYDRALNKPVPDSEECVVKTAISDWKSLGDAQKQLYPTPYHTFVRTPDPRQLEDDFAVGLAFSGGGSRAAMFGAYCVLELQKIIRDNEATTVDFLDEVDYVSGISGGSFPATGFVLAKRADEGPPFDSFALDKWPDVFDTSLQKRAGRYVLMHPHVLVRDLVIESNLRPAFIAAINRSYFEKGLFNNRRPLCFGDLSDSPVLMLGASIVTEPSSPLVISRLPYLYSFQKDSNLPWNSEIRTLESFHSDPMSYPLAAAIYSSASFPGLLRSGVIKMHQDPTWVERELETPEHQNALRIQSRARKTVALEGEEKTGEKKDRTYPLLFPYGSVYEVKDGGLWDNLGAEPLLSVIEKVGLSPGGKRVILLCDASPRGIAAPELPPRHPDSNWLRELVGSTNFAWQTGQDNLSVAAQRKARRYDVKYFDFGYLDFITDHYTYEQEFRGTDVPDTESDNKLLRKEILAKQKPSNESARIRNETELLQTMRTIKTDFGKFSEKQKNALRICAAYAVQRRKLEILKPFSLKMES